MELRATLESPLPRALPTGLSTAVFCYGTCFHTEERVKRLAILVDGAPHAPAAWRMPRILDDGLGRRSYRSGYWVTVPVRTGERPGTVELSAAVRLASGRELVAPLARIQVVVEHGRSPSHEGRGAHDLIAVCMGSYDPDPELFRVQVESLRAQTDRRWICLISDDHSSPERFADIERTVGDDRRFVVSRSERRLGFYRNFERALGMVPAEASLVALCDQDDRWRPDKLETLRGALGQSLLVYSDQRLVGRDGRILRETLWEGRRNNHTNLASLLVANTLTGAATLFRRELAELAVPFPDTPGLQFHDHWLALVALAAGDIGYVDRPLYDYVQHPGAVFGEVTSEAKAAATRPSLRGFMHRWRSAYFYGYLGREVQAQVLLARCSGRLTPRKRRALERFVNSDRSPLALAWLAARPLRCLVGRTETLGSELDFVRGLLWRRLLLLRASWPGRPRVDASFPRVGPESFEQRRLRRWRSRI